MSYPYWPQSRFGYRPSIKPMSPTPASYGGFGGVAYRGAGYSRGSLSSKVGWSTPQYIVDEPESVGYGGFGGVDSATLPCFNSELNALAQKIAGIGFDVELPFPFGKQRVTIGTFYGADKIAALFGRAEGALFGALVNAAQSNRDAFNNAVRQYLGTWSIDVKLPIVDYTVPIRPADLDIVLNALYGFFTEMLGRCVPKTAPAAQVSPFMLSVLPGMFPIVKPIQMQVMEPMQAKTKTVASFVAQQAQQAQQKTSPIVPLALAAAAGLLIYMQTKGA